MIQHLKKYLALFLIAMIALWGLPVAAFADTDPLPNQDDNGKMCYDLNSYYTFNIKGYVGGSLYRTTYGDAGYVVSLLDGAARYDLNGLQNGVETIVNENFGLTLKLSFVSNGNYVKVQYIVRNLSEEQKTFSLGTYSDTQIGSNDYAPLEIVDNSTLVMRDGSAAQFNIVGRNAYGVTDVSTFWIGYYTGNYSNTFNQSPITTLSNTDSGLAFSWKDKVLDGGESMTLSVLFGVGAVNNAPAVAMDATPDEIGLSDDLSLAGTVTDSENSTGTMLYYVLDDGEPVLLHTFSDAPGAFSYSLDLPATLDFLGTHKVVVFAEDSDGAISQSVVREFDVVLPPLQGIALATLPTKLAYHAGEALDFSGLAINLLYENGLILPLEEFNLSIPEGTIVDAAGTFPVQVTYTVGQMTYQAEFYYTVAAEASTDTDDQPDIISTDTDDQADSTSTQTDEEEAAPDTGDQAMGSLMALVTMISLIGMAVVARRRFDA